MTAGSLHWIEPQESEEFPVEVQLRYRSQPVPCLVRAGADGTCEARFESVFPPVTPGQAAVFYRGDQVLGGGWIEKAISKEAVSSQPKTLS